MRNCALFIALFTGFLWLVSHTAAADVPANDHSDELPPGAVGQLGTLSLRCRYEINCVAFSPDGRYVAAGDDAGIDLWNCATGKLVRRLYQGRTIDLVFTPDGQTLISAAHGVVYYWDVCTGKLIRSIETNGIVSALAVSADGEISATGTTLGDIFIWGQHGRKLIRHIKTSSSLEWLTFSPDGRWLVSTGWSLETNETVRFWDVATGKQLWQHRGQDLETYWRNSVAISSNGMLFAMGTEEGRIQIWDIRKREKIRVLAHPKSKKRVRVLGFRDNDSLLFSQGHGGEILIWDTRTGRLKQALQTAFTWQLDLSPDGNTIAYADGNTVKLWGIKAQEHRHRLPGHQRLIRSVAFSPDGKRLASCGDDHTIRIWDVETKKELREWRTGADNHGWNVTFSPDGKTLVSANWQDVQLWDTSTGRLRMTVGDKKSFGLAQARLVPDQKTVVTANYRQVQVWSVKSRSIVRTISGPPDSTQEIAVSPNGRLAAILGRKKDESYRVFVWDSATAKLLGELNQHAIGFEVMAFSPDGKYLAVADATTEIRVWDIRRMKPVQLIRTRDEVQAVAFNRTGRYLASVDDGRKIRIWDVKSGTLAGQFFSPRGQLLCLAFSPTKDILAAAGNDCTITLWDLQKKAPAEIPPKDRHLRQLVRAYKSYGLPLPPMNSKPVIHRDDIGSRFGFLVKSVDKKEPPIMMIGTGPFPELDPKGAVEATIKNLHNATNATSTYDDLVSAIQCKARGFDGLALALFKTSPDVVPHSAEEDLASVAWDFWSGKLLDPNEKRTPIARRLRFILDANPNTFPLHKKELLRCLDLALAPSKAKPGSLEAMVDDLIELRNPPFFGSPKQEEQAEAPYRKLANRGFAAVPTLIKHLDDDRLTKNYNWGFNNFPGYHYRVRDVLTDMLLEIAGKDFGLFRLRGDRLPRITAEIWWKQASKIGEEAYMVRHVLSEKDAEWPNELMLEMIVKKYPKRLPKIYRQMLQERPRMVGWPVARAVANSSLPGERKRELLRLGVKSKNASHRRGALRYLGKLDSQ